MKEGKKEKRSAGRLTDKQTEKEKERARGKG